MSLADAQEPARTTTRDPDFDAPGNVSDVFHSASVIDLDDADFVGNPLRTETSWWPEDLVVASVPGRSPQLGWSLTMVGGYFLDDDDDTEDAEKSKPSLIGAFGMVAENGSYAFGAGSNLHLLDDKLRIKAGAAYMDVKYRYYGQGSIQNDLGISVNILQEAPLYFVEGTWRVWRKLYVGAGYLAGNVESRLDISPEEESPFLPLPGSLDLDIAALSVPVQYDSRDHEQFPREGWLINGRGMFYRESLGGDFDAHTVKLAVNHYRPVRDSDVLAFRAMVRTTDGDAPFFLLSQFGGSTDLRGYPSGRYRDRMMYATQAEYRWTISPRWILTGFAGFGEVAEKLSEIGDDFLPAAGVGARFVLSRKHEVSLSTDIAVGNDGWEFYFGVGEAF
jgi:outer membrane protein assembly factor BamA